MWNPFRNKQKEDQIKRDLDSLPRLNMFQFFGMDLPILNEDANRYINKWWRNVGCVYTVY